MTKRNIKRGIAKNFGSMAPYMPVIFLGIAAFFLLQYFKNSGGLIASVKKLLGLGGENEQDKASGETALDLVAQVMKEKKLAPNALHISRANSLFDLFNSKPSSNPFLLFDTGLSEEISKQIFDLYNNVQWTADDAMIYAAYGRRKANNRIMPLGGLFYDDTTGDLRKHSLKYLDEKYRDSMLNLIDRAIKAYLI